MISHGSTLAQKPFLGLLLWRHGLDLPLEWVMARYVVMCLTPYVPTQVSASTEHFLNRKRF